MGLEGRAAIVTGGAGSIGYAGAEALARAGADVLLVDIDTDGLARCKGELAAHGGQVETIVADCSVSAEVQRYVTFAQEKFGRIDAFFNNAGVPGKLAPSHEYDEDEFDRIIRINLRSQFLGLRHVLPVMVAAGRGAVVNTASIASERGLAGAIAYNASKHAVLGLTRTAASDVGPMGVRVNAVMPGVINTPLLENMLVKLFDGDVAGGKKVLGKNATLDRIGTPAEIGEVVAFLLSDRASFVNGAAWAIDGGALSTIRH